MQFNKFKLSIFMALYFVFALSCSAFAKYPERPITMVIPWTAGGGSDAVGRAIAKPMEKILGQPIVVVNKDGGAGSIGNSFVAHSRPDGYTIGMINNSGFIHQLHYGGVDYKKEDLEILCIFLRVPVILAVPSTSEIKTLKDYIEYAKANPGKLLLGISSAGGSTHLPIEEFFVKAGIKVTPMPFKGGGPAITALVGGHVSSASAHPSELVGHYKAGNIRLLAVAEEKRLDVLPEIPTFKEQGYDVVDAVWRTFSVPKGVPADIKEKLIQTVSEAIKDTGFVTLLDRLGDNIWYKGPEEAKAIMEADDIRTLEIIKNLGMYQKNAKK